MASQHYPTRRAFLNEKRFAVLATINKDGTPQQTVMWYELQGDEIMMNTAHGRLKDRNLAARPAHLDLHRGRAALRHVARHRRR